MEQTLIGLDVGTTGVTAVLFSMEPEAGLVPVGRYYREFSQHYPASGWVEHHGDELLGAVDTVLAETLGDPKAANVLGLGLTNQRETVFALDRADRGAPLFPGIVWQDRRTEPRCAELRSRPGLGERIEEITGLRLDPYFSGTKIEWMLEHHKGLRARAEAGEVCFGTVDTLVLAHLTAGKCLGTDPTNASRTMLFDIEERCWSSELCDLLGVDMAWLPDVRPSFSNFGMAQIAGRSIPIVGVAGDQQAALFGHGATEPGDLKCTFGTGLFLLLNAGTERPMLQKSGLLTTLALNQDGDPVFALEGSIFMGGAILQWMRDELCILGSATESEAVASSVPDTGGVILVPAFTGLGAPHWDAEARAALLGMSRGSGRAHIVRAGLEAIAMQCAELVEFLRRDTELEIGSMRVDGGATANGLLMQMQADFAGLEVLRPRLLDVTALGAAKLAALGLGRLENSAPPEIEARFAPGQEGLREQRLVDWRSAVSRIRST